MRVRVEASGIGRGGFIDYCLYLTRSKGPVVYRPAPGAFSGLLCSSGYYPRTDNNRLTKSADFSQMPIFVPAGTEVTCNANFGNLKPDQLRQIRRTCTVEYEPYRPGDARYRVLRIPYIDQMVRPTAPFLTSRYQAPDATWPLQIKGVTVYAAFSGSGSPAPSLDTCLREVRPDGSVARQWCLPRQTYSSDGSYTSPGFIKLDWRIDRPNYLDATCVPHNTRNAAGCAYYLIVEIPANIPAGPASVFRDHNFVPRTFLNGWCEERSKMGDVISNQLCGPGAKTCETNVKVANCLALFK